MFKHEEMPFLINKSQLNFPWIASSNFLAAFSVSSFIIVYYLSQMQQHCYSHTLILTMTTLLVDTYSLGKWFSISFLLSITGAKSFNCFHDHNYYYLSQSPYPCSNPFAKLLQTHHSLNPLDCFNYPTNLGTYPYTSTCGLTCQHSLGQTFCQIAYQYCISY